MSLSGQYLLCLFCFFGRKGGYGGWGQDKKNQENLKKTDRDADPADDDRPGDNGHADSKLAGNRLVSGSLQVAARGQPAVGKPSARVKPDPGCKNRRNIGC